MLNNRLEKLKDKVRNGGIAIGTAVTLTDAIVSELLGSLGYDFLWIDQEHSVLSEEQIRAHIMASELVGTATVVRVRDHNPATVKPILEIAPDAVIFPMINTIDEAKRAVAACRYPPGGIRGYGPVRANRFGQIPNDEYLANIDRCLMKIMQIEHVEAVRNLDGILSVDGVDSIVVGPNDLSASVGLLGQHRHPRVLALMDEIALKCRTHQMPFGVSLGYDEENISDWKHRGVSWIEIGSDRTCLGDGARMNLDGARKIFENA